MSGLSGHGATHALSAAYYPDAARHERVEIIENVRMARDTYRIRLACPEIARRIVPGQFMMLRLPGGNDPLLGRPFALYDTWLDEAGEPLGLDVAYLVVGRMTRRLAAVDAGEELEIWGPLGNGFKPTSVDHLVMVAGGIGQTPFLALGREALGGRRYGSPPRNSGWAKRVTLCYGVRTKDLLAGGEDFTAAGIALRVTSDDGSVGRQGFATDALAEVLAHESDESRRIVCCGPEPMMERVAEIARERSVCCEVSLETPMACGIGICFSCVVRVCEADGGWDYKRTCVEGPVFDAQKIDW